MCKACGAHVGRLLIAVSAHIDSRIERWGNKDILHSGVSWAIVKRTGGRDLPHIDCDVRRLSAEAARGSKNDRAGIAVAGADKGTVRGWDQKRMCELQAAANQNFIDPYVDFLQDHIRVDMITESISNRMA